MPNAIDFGVDVVKLTESSTAAERMNGRKYERGMRLAFVAASPTFREIMRQKNWKLNGLTATDAQMWNVERDFIKLRACDAKGFWHSFTM